jgi:hypothetical protein
MIKYSPNKAVVRMKEEIAATQKVRKRVQLTILQ